MNDWNQPEYAAISKEEAEECKRAYLENGVPGCMKYFQQKNDEWQNISVKIAVIGNSGVGKSTFINTIRRMTSEDEGSAAVDVNQSTVKIARYEHPQNKLITFWDLPGVGTPKFPKNEYLEKVEVDDYDCFLIMSAGRFTENDAWLGKEISNRKKGIYFVRTKIGNDVRSDKHEKKKLHNESEVVKRILNKTEEELRLLNVKACVFLIDSHKQARYDFDNLEQKIINDLPKQQRSAMLFSLSAFSVAMVKAKVAELRSRAWKAAIMSASVAAIPLPGLSVICDIGILSTELHFYYRQLGLDNDSLIQRANILSVSHASLQEIVRRDFPIEEFSQAFVKNFLLASVHLVGLLLVEEVSRFIPIIGSLIAAPISLATTRYVLTTMLEKMENTSLELANFVTKNEAEECDSDMESD